MFLGCCAAVTSTVLAAAQTGATDLNRIRFSGRAAFNVEGGFKDVGRLTLNPGTSTTPDGSPYNYDDGYVLTDVSGNAGGQTWNWGYDNPSQISGNSIQMHRAAALESSSTDAGLVSDDVSPGFELVFGRKLGGDGAFSYGIEAAMSYLRVSLDHTSQGSANLTLTTDLYGFTQGTTPPTAPYQGTFNGPGFLIGSTPVSSTTSSGTVGVLGSQELESNIWGWRAGPYLDLAIAERVQLSLSLGLALALVDVTGSWSETTTLTGQNPTTISDGGSDTDLQWGAYVGLHALWQLTPHWSAVAGVQYEYLDAYEGDLGGRSAELKFGKSFSVTLGVSCGF